MPRLNKAIRFAVDFANAAQRANLEPFALGELVALAEKAFHEGERYCNEPNRDKHRDKSYRAFEEKAAAHGLAVKWHGLYPSIYRDGQQLFFPSAD